MHNLTKLTRIAVLLLLGTSPAAVAQSNTTEAELLPRSILFDNPERAGVQISPDGRHLSWVAPLNGVMNVWVAPTDDPSSARAVTNDTGRGIRGYRWTYNNTDILYIQDQGGDENWRIYRANIQTGDALDLTPVSGISAQILQVSYKHPDTILVLINERTPQLHDVYRIDLTTGERHLVVENPGFAGLIADDELHIRLGTQMLPDGSMSVLQREGDNWAPLLSIPYEDAMTTSIVGVEANSNRALAIDSRGRDTAALVTLDMATGASEILYSNPLADVSGVIVHPTSNRVEAAASNYLRTEWEVLDDTITADFTYLNSLTDGEFVISSRTLDDSQWVVVLTAADQPASYYLYDRESRNVQYLFGNRPALEGKTLAAMHPLVIPARDGLQLVSYLTLPPGSNSSGDARPDAPVPMVLLVHGGPWARDGYGYNSYHQWLANRGYAVLSVNFRGSTGFGKSFVNAGDREWGGKMHDDLIDAVNWAINNGITDEDRVAIMGGSYGGYATLAGLTFTPDVFACGVDIVGPSNIATLLESIPPYWAPMVEMFANRVGDHRTEQGRTFLESRSPLNFVERIQRPLLIGQGANDPRVKQSESDQIVDAMRAQNIPVTYVLYPDEGHGFARPENNKSFNAVTEGFLSACLGGRAEPIGSDLQGASLQVPEGVQHVPGLADALLSISADN